MATASADSDDDQLDQLLLEGSLRYEKEVECQPGDEEIEDSSLDNLLLQASLEYESQIREEDAPGRFQFCSDNEIEQCMRDAIPKKTVKQTSWCIRLWSEWRESSE